MLHDVRQVDVIEDPAAAVVALDPVRARLLAELREEPASAATLAARVGLARQKVNYHLRTLESHGLVELAEIRMRGGISERMLRATSATYVVSPAAIAGNGARPEQVADQLSADYLISLAGRIVHEVGTQAAAGGRRRPATADVHARRRGAVHVRRRPRRVRRRAGDRRARPRRPLPPR